MEPFFYTHKLYFVFILLYPLLIDEHVLVLEPKSFIAKSKRDNLTLLFDQRSQTPVRYLKWNSCISLAVSSVRILNERHMSHSGIKSYNRYTIPNLFLSEVAQIKSLLFFNEKEVYIVFSIFQLTVRPMKWGPTITKLAIFFSSLFLDFF